MKYIFLLFLSVAQLMAALIKVPVTSVDGDAKHITVAIAEIQKGVSGYIVHHINDQHSAILKNVVVESYDAKNHLARLRLYDFDALANNSLPYGKWQVEAGDEVELAFGYTRALLIAPSEQVYHKISKSVAVQWVHPDLFATILSFAGHPTPLHEDFVKFANAASVGLVFLYLDGKIYTVDAKSFVILSVTDAPLEVQKKQKPFYSRVEKIAAAWWGEGSSEMSAYAPHYFELLIENNPKNKALYEAVKNSKNEEIRELLSDFDLGK